jgi:hypothetical protein
MCICVADGVSIFWRVVWLGETALLQETLIARGEWTENKEAQVTVWATNSWVQTTHTEESWDEASRD